MRDTTKDYSESGLAACPSHMFSIFDLFVDASGNFDSMRNEKKWTERITLPPSPTYTTSIKGFRGSLRQNASCNGVLNC
jgi:hypothetical protein